jgi:segregation and condensation protein B
MKISKLKKILEAVLLAAERTLTVVQLEALFELDEERPTRDEIRKALHEMVADNEQRGYEVKEVASGYRLQVKQEFATWVGRLWEEKPARYTRALLETMALIAYRQPITRGEIEEVRGVSVSSNIIKTLLERDWIKVLGHKDVPGKPTLYGTTKGFLDYFNLKKLDELPTLAEIKDLDAIHPELELDEDAISEQSASDPDATDNKEDNAENKMDDGAEINDSETKAETDATEQADASQLADDVDVASIEVPTQEQAQDEQSQDEQSPEAEQDESDDNSARQAFNV